MAHFAKLDENNVVVDCIVIDNDNAPDPAPSNSESIGKTFIAALAQYDERLLGEWVQTSYHGSFRKQYAGLGFVYNAEADVFVAPQPYPSWTLDVNYDWQPPVPMPSGGGPWIWDEATLSWVEVTDDNS